MRDLRSRTFAAIKSQAACVHDKIRQQLQVRSLPDGFIVGRPFTLSQSKCNLLEFLGSRFYRLT